MLRDAEGRAQVEDPVAGKDAVNKDYADGNFAVINHVHDECGQTVTWESLSDRPNLDIFATKDYVDEFAALVASMPGGASSSASGSNCQYAFYAS